MIYSTVQGNCRKKELRNFLKFLAFVSLTILEYPRHSNFLDFLGIGHLNILEYSLNSKPKDLPNCQIVFHGYS